MLLRKCRNLADNGFQYKNEEKQRRLTEKGKKYVAENEGLNTYRKYTDVTTGKEFLIDKNRKTIPLSKPKAHNFKVIQGGKKGKNRKTKKRMIK